MEKLQRLMQLKDDQLAKLQAQVGPGWREQLLGVLGYRRMGLCDDSPPLRLARTIYIIE